MALVYGLSLFLLGSRCVPPPEPDPPPVEGTCCERACQRMAQLECPGHEGSPEGASCVEVCEHTESSGVARFCCEDVAAIRACNELEHAFEACE
jgi:hypothetical protein